MGKSDAALKDMAAQLAVMLRGEGEKGREAWTQLHGKLAEVAAMAGNNPRTAVKAILKVAKDASSSQALERSVSKINPGLQVKDLVLLVAYELNMTPLCNSGDAVQMVDEGNNFCEVDVERIIKSSAELSTPNAPYAVVSIIGAQSSGKSYLLNRLFGTRFPEMDATRGWKKTTSGIMMSRCIEPSLLVLDVEGFDGIENEEGPLFENQAALFALTVSDLMIVNMSIANSGLEQGGGSILFRTIFKEMTKIESGGLTKILVVLRHYNGETPLEILKRDVSERLQMIWESVNEKSMKFKHYIEVDTFGMPDKDSPKFPEEVIALRRLLSENRSAKVPASSFTDSSKIIWENIKKNKKLDIPAHKVLVANSHCRRVVEDILSSLHSLEEYKTLKDELLKVEPSPSLFKEKTDAISSRIRTRYDLETRMYDPDVRDKERKSMVEELDKIITDHAKELIRKMKEKTAEKFKGEFDGNIKTYNTITDQHAKLMVEECLCKFTDSCEDLKVYDSVYLQLIYRQLKDEIQLHTSIRIQEIMAELERKAEEVKNRPFIIKLGSCLGSLFVT